MLALAAISLGNVTREQNDDCVKRRVGKSSIPLLRAVGPREAQRLGTRGKTLAEFLGKRGERCLIDAERLQPAPGECDGDPSRIGRLLGYVRRGADLVDQPGEPRFAGVCRLERQKLVS